MEILSLQIENYERLEKMDYIFYLKKSCPKKYNITRKHPKYNTTVDTNHQFGDSEKVQPCSHENKNTKGLIGLCFSAIIN